MWCPNCRREVPEDCTACPDCGAAPVAMVVAFRPPREIRRPARGERMAFLMDLPDPEDRELAMDLLEESGIPYEIRPDGGTELYVNQRYTHRALRLLRRFDADAQAPFSDEELDAAMENFYADYGPEAEEEDPAEPVSPEGYRMVFWFLGIFALLVLAAVIFG